MSEQLASFRRQLERDCKIVRWAPTSDDLREIARRIASAGHQTEDIAHQAVISVCPRTIFSVMEGIDNSDIRVLLALATSVASEG